MAEENKKKSKKGLIIAILLIIVIIIVAVVVVVMMNSSSDEENEKDKTTGVEWGDSYYIYLVEDVEADIDDILNDEELEKVEIAFVELEDFEYPVMIVEGLLDNENTILITAYIEDEEVEAVTNQYSIDVDIEYLYDVEKESYDWYAHSSDNVYEYYETLSNTINFDTTTVFSVEKDIGLDEMEQIFVETDIELEKTEINLGNEDEILESVKQLTENYKTTEELLTDEIKANIEDKVLEIQEELEELSNVLSDEEALEIGYELYYYGEYPAYDDGDLVEYNYEDTFAYSSTYPYAFKFLDASSVEDYYTEDCLSDFANHITAMFTIEEHDGDWYFLTGDYGSDQTLIGVLLTVDEITSDTITFTATSYYSNDYASSWDDEEIEIYNSYENIEDYVENAITRFSYETAEYDFVIKLEDDKWKIDQQYAEP